MYKKLLAPVILALVAALAFSSVGYAANKTPANVYHLKGRIFNVDISAMTIRIFTTKGRQTIHLDNNTIYKGLVTSLAQLTPSMVVNVKAKLLPDGDYLALSVNVIRIEKVLQIDGQVTATAVHAMNFTILGTDGNTYNFVVKAKTTFSGHRVTNLSGLRPGMQVSVDYLVMSDGRLRALDVTVTGTN